MKFDDLILIESLLEGSIRNISKNISMHKGQPQREIDILKKYLSKLEGANARLKRLIDKVEESIEPEILEKILSDYEDFQM